MMLMATGRLDNFLQFIGALFVFLLVLLVTWVVTRWIGNYQKVQMKNQNMQVVETMRISNGKYIQIVKVAEEFLVISITKEHVELLTKLDEKSVSDIHLPDEERQGTFQESFQEIRRRMKKGKK